MSSNNIVVNVLEMKCLRSLVGVSRMDRVRNDEVRRRAGIEREKGPPGWKWIASSVLPLLLHFTW